MIAVVLDAETIGVFISKTGMDRGVTEWIIAFSSRGEDKRQFPRLIWGHSFYACNALPPCLLFSRFLAWHWLCYEEK
jgi:hypothetical protein